MKSTLRIAAAGACLSALALAATPVRAASSNVTLYGLIDTGLQYVSNGRAATARRASARAT